MCVFGVNEWCTDSDPCFTCADLTHRDAHPEPVDGCQTCRLRSVQLSPQATPNKTRRYMKPGPRRSNSWERGIPTDNRGMPWLTPGTVAPVGAKQYAEQRTSIESARRQLTNA